MLWLAPTVSESQEDVASHRGTKKRRANWISRGVVISRSSCANQSQPEHSAARVAGAMEILPPPGAQGGDDVRQLPLDRNPPSPQVVDERAGLLPSALAVIGQ